MHNSSFIREQYLALSIQKISDNEKQELQHNPHFYARPFGLHAHTHSKLIDKILGIHTNKVEQKLQQKYRSYFKTSDDGGKQHFEGAQSWIGLHPQVLQTPYSEMLEMINLLMPFQPQTLVDLGCGYGRMGLMLKALLPNCQFTGYEIVKPRIDEGRRVFEFYGLDTQSIIEKNILDTNFALPLADVYFIYDFGNMPDIKQLLSQLLHLNQSRSFFVVARGKGVRSLINHRFSTLWTLHQPIHKKEWSLYRHG